MKQSTMIQNQTINTKYPHGVMPNQVNSEIVKPCIHCGNEFGLKRWDSWNGFLVECPYCGGFHGKHWSIRNILLATILFSALSFFFTMRLRNAILAFTAFLIYILFVNFLISKEVLPALVEIIAASLFILGPMIVNGVLLVIHERDIDNSTPSKQRLANAPR